MFKFGDPAQMSPLKQSEVDDELNRHRIAWAEHKQLDNFKQANCLCCDVSACYFPIDDCRKCSCFNSKFYGVVYTTYRMLSVDGEVRTCCRPKVSVRSIYDVIGPPFVYEVAGKTSCCCMMGSIEETHTELKVQTLDGWYELGRVTDLKGALADLWPAWKIAADLPWMNKGDEKVQVVNKLQNFNGVSKET